MALMTKIWTLAEYHQVVDAGVLWLVEYRTRA